MKMNNIIKSMLAVALLSLGACSTDEGVEDTLPAEQVEMVKIRVETGGKSGVLSRTTLDGNKVVWTLGDQVGVCCRVRWTDENGVEQTENCDAYPLTVTEVKDGGVTAVLEGEVPAKFVAYPDNDLYYAYPYWSNMRLHGVFDILENASIPAIQKIVPNSFDNGVNLSTTKAKWGDPVIFNNVLGLLRLRIQGNAAISKITIAPETIKAPNSTSDSSLACTDTWVDNNSVRHDVRSNSSKTITLEPEGTLQLTDEVLTLYAAIIPTTLSNVVIEFTNHEGIVLKKTVAWDSVLVDKGNIVTLNKEAFVINAEDFVDETFDVDFDAAENLSDAGKANTYYVSAPGVYCIDATVKGNDPTQTIAPNGAVLLYHNTVQTAWLSSDVCPIIPESVTLKDGKIYLQTSDEWVNGNVVIAALDTKLLPRQITADDSHVLTNVNVLWSWNLVFSKDYDINAAENQITAGDYTFMGRNLGAVIDAKEYVTALGGVNNPIALAAISGNTYQWGRKDAFPGAIDYSWQRIDEQNIFGNPSFTTIGALNWGVVGTKYNNGSAVDQIFKKDKAIAVTDVVAEHTTANVQAFATANPHLWLNHSSNYLPVDDAATATAWSNNGAKTINDPCPAGWQVASREAWDALFAKGVAIDTEKHDRIFWLDGTWALPVVGAANTNGSGTCARQNNGNLNSVYYSYMRTGNVVYGGPISLCFVSNEVGGVAVVRQESINDDGSSVQYWSGNVETANMQINTACGAPVRCVKIK